MLKSKAYRLKNEQNYYLYACAGWVVYLMSCCSGHLKMFAMIDDPPVIRNIPTHLRLSPHPPPRAPARYDPFGRRVSIKHTV